MTALLALALALTSVPVQDLDVAERAYRAGRYAEALALFEAALSEPASPHGPVLYNMGNCAYRLGRHAQAVLFYRRAQLRMPRDAQVAFNLRLAEQQLGVGSAGASWYASRSPGTLLLLVILVQSAGLAGWVLLPRGRAVRLPMVALVVLGFVGVARLVQMQWMAEPPEGVVLEHEIAVRSEPHLGVGAIMRLEAGQTVRVAELSDRWARVVHPRGGGWIERAGVGIVE